MAIWWLNVANEIAALRKSGAERPEAHFPDMFSDDGPAIETSYRVVPLRSARPPAPQPVAELPPPPERESRFHPEGHLFNTGRGESSFLAEGRRRKNTRSWA